MPHARTLIRDACLLLAIALVVAVAIGVVWVLRKL